MSTQQPVSCARYHLLLACLIVGFTTPANAQHFPDAGKVTFPEADGDGDQLWVSGFNFPNNYGASVDTSGETNTWQFDRTPMAGIEFGAMENQPTQVGGTGVQGAFWTAHNTFWPGIPGGYEVNLGNGNPKNPSHTSYDLLGFRWPGVISELEVNTASGGPFSNDVDQPWGFAIENLNYISPSTGEIQHLPLLTVDQTIFIYFRNGGPNGNGIQVGGTEAQYDAAGVSYGPHPVDFLNGALNPRQVVFLSDEGDADDAPNNQGDTWDIWAGSSGQAGIPYAILTALGGPNMDGLRIGALVYQAIPGDYNLDGIVDIADYTTWADNFGNTNASFEQGDGNLDGVVDIADYTTWADHFGLGVPPPAQVPEPSVGILLLTGMLMFVVRRRRPK